MSTVFITNIPAPYRELVHEQAAKELKGEYHVIYCAPIEKNRSWKFKLGNYPRTFLTGRTLSYRGRAIYFGSNIRTVLDELNPEVVVIGGFSLPMLIAYIWAMQRKKKILSFSDANLHSEALLSPLHKLIRKIFYGRSHGFIGASKKTLALFQSYGADAAQLFQSHLCADNALFDGSRKNFSEREFDIILCGQMIPGKMFDFSLDVISLIQQTRPDIKVKLLGSGPLKDHIIARLEQSKIIYDYPGFVEQELLPLHYASAKLFFFPSQRDAWGVVANESCAAGTPVFTCPVVGAADELIVNNHNGCVMEPVADLWAEQAIKLLENIPQWQQLSDNAVASVTPYTYENAANGIVEAVRYVRNQRAV